MLGGKQMSTQVRSSVSNFDGAQPALPDLLEPRVPKPFRPQPFLQPWPPSHIRTLRGGCYLIKLTSSTNVLSVADGTLRVECHDNGCAASGDLYQRRVVQICLPQLPGLSRRCVPVMLPVPSPAGGIPIFPRDSYRYFLKVTQVLETFTLADNFTLGFEMHRFHSDTQTWTNEGAFTALMVWMTAPAGYPSSGNYLEGDVKNSAGVVMGRLTMGWVSDYLRRAVIEIDRVPASEVPLNNGAEVNWRSIFDQVGWDVIVVESNATMAEESDESRSDAECHHARLEWRDTDDLDEQWHYHLHPNDGAGNYIMQVTPQIALNAVAPVHFSDAVEWAFLAEDQRLLRHLPDIAVRPGSALRFGTDISPAYAVPLSPLDTVAEGLKVQVAPLLEAVPLGA
jgi:hypothetical protein